MAQCLGTQTLGAKVDQATIDLIDELADQCGVSRAEVVRRLLDDLRRSEEGELRCPECRNVIRFQPCP